MDNKQLLQDLKDDCRAVDWDGYIPAIEALEAERDALLAEVAEKQEYEALYMNAIQNLFAAERAAEALLEWVERLKAQVPDVLFDGYAVYKAIPESNHVSADHVALVLNAAVRLIRESKEHSNG